MTNDVDQISILDIGVVLAENWMTILLAPLILSVLVYAGASAMQPTVAATIELAIPIDSESGDFSVDPGLLYGAAFAYREGVSTTMSCSESQELGRVLPCDSIIFTAKASSEEEAIELAQEAYKAAAAALVADFQSQFSDAQAAIAIVAPFVRIVEDSLEDEPHNGRVLLDLTASLVMYQGRAELASDMINSLQEEPFARIDRIGMPPLQVAVTVWIASTCLVLVVLALWLAFRGVSAMEEGRTNRSRLGRKLA